MWNPFQGGQKSEKDQAPKKSGVIKDVAGMPGMPDTKDMNMFQRFAMKRLMKMSPEEREKTLRKAMTPKNIAKHKGEILAQLESMRKSGQISDDQYRLSRKKLGI